MPLTQRSMDSLIPLSQDQGFTSQQTQLTQLTQSQFTQPQDVAFASTQDFQSQQDAHDFLEFNSQSQFDDDYDAQPEAVHRKPTTSRPETKQPPKEGNNHTHQQPFDEVTNAIAELNFEEPLDDEPVEYDLKSLPEHACR